MKGRFVSKSLSILAFILLAGQFCLATTAWRDYRTDLVSIAGNPFTAEELEIAEYVLLYYCLIGGVAQMDSSLDTSLQNLPEEDYWKAITVAEKVGTNPAAKGLLKLGKIGEKLLKAIIVSAENLVAATLEYVDSAAAEYDRKH